MELSRRNHELGQATIELTGVLVVIALMFTAITATGLPARVASKLTCAVETVFHVDGCASDAGAGQAGGGQPQDPYQRLAAELLAGAQPRAMPGLTGAEYEALQRSFAATQQYAARIDNTPLYERAGAAAAALLQAARNTPGLLAGVLRYLGSGGGTSGATTGAPGADDTGQVAYGSTPLSQAALSYRRANGLTSGRNVAVFEYETQSGTKTLAMASQRGVGHAERLAWQELSEQGVEPAQVKAIYSELQPCTLPFAYCAPWIARTFPDAGVSYSFAYGDTAESRAEGVEQLTKTLAELASEGELEDR